MSKKSSAKLPFIHGFAEIPEIKTLLEQRKHITAQLRKVRRRIVTKSKEYAFLVNMVMPNNDDQYALEKALKEYFIAIGYEKNKVKWLGKHSDREDLQLHGGHRITMIEAKNVSKDNIKQSDITQPHFRIELLKNNPEFKGKELHGLIIANCENAIPIMKRKKIPLDKNKVEYLANAGYGFVTTQELVLIFLSFKAGDISLEEFDRQLHQIGVIEFRVNKSALQARPS